MVLPGPVSEIDPQTGRLNYPVIRQQHLMRIQVVCIEFDL
jgi:hypothetical protein